MEAVCIGDSIAVGISSAFDCVRMAEVGRTSSQQAALIKIVSADTAIISLGSNDPRNPDLYRNLRHIRAHVVARKVIWIMPYDQKAADAVRQVAAYRGDGTLSLRNFVTKDGVHPINYRAVAREAARE
jgi:hypothetical protein